MISGSKKPSQVFLLILVTISLFAGAAVLLAGVPSSANSDGLLEDIRSARDSRGTADVTEAVRRHIKPGDDINTVIQLLEEAGFKVTKRGEGGIYYAERINQQYSMGYDAYEITFYAPDGVVKEIQIAWAAYRGP